MSLDYFCINGYRNETGEEMEKEDREVGGR